MDFSVLDEDLTDWKARYQHLLDTLNMGFMLFDMYYNCYDINETLLEWLGGKREDYVGSNTRDWFSEEEFEELYNLVEPQEMELKAYKSKDEKKYYQFEWYMYHASGEKIPLLFNGAINMNRKGEHESTYITCLDLREQKKIQEELEKEKKKLEAILFGIGDCVTIYDLSGDVLLCNPQGVEMRGRRNKPFLPLKAGSKAELTLSLDKEKHQFRGQVEPVHDGSGSTYAYVEILRDVTNQIKLEQTEEELLQVKREIKRLGLNSEMIGASQSMRNVFDVIMRCAEVDSTIMVLGETGVGKELVARAIHDQSIRKEKPFVAVNCGALPEPLLESELFGHVKGAFTGAISERRGLFRAAEGGTLLLDEVGDLSTTLQIKLLRVLQEKEARPVGSSQTYPVDVRVVGATHRNLNEMVKQNDFRRDLYYRLAVIPIMIPPLRQRKDDILPLCEHFIKKHSKSANRPLKTLDHSSQKILLDYAWPGNIRELENCIEHAIAMTSESTILPNALPVQIVFPQSDINGGNHVHATQHDFLGTNKDVNDFNLKQGEDLLGPGLKPWELKEKKAIEETLIRNSGNRTRTAKDLGMCRTSLWRKIKMYGVNI